MRTFARPKTMTVPVRECAIPTGPTASTVERLSDKACLSSTAGHAPFRGAEARRTHMAHAISHPSRRQDGTGDAQIQRQQAQDETCPCSTRPRCDDEKTGMIEAAFRLAATWIAPASAKMGRYVSSTPQQRRGTPAATALRRHFSWPSGQGAPSRPTPDLVLSVIDRLPGHFGAIICPSCPTECPSDDGDVYARAQRGAGNNCYEFCPPFFAEPGETSKNRLRATVAIHEMMHTWESMGDVAYEGNADYPPNAYTAQHNADSYANLIRDLGQ